MKLKLRKMKSLAGFLLIIVFSFCFTVHKVFGKQWIDLTPDPPRVSLEDDNINFKYQSVNVWVNPNDYSAEPMESFSMVIKIGPVNHLMAFATELLFDPSVVSITSLSEGGFLNENGNVQTSFLKTIDNQQGRCVIAISRMTNPPSGVSSEENNTVLTVHFKANNPGYSSVNLINTGLIHPDGVTTYDAVVSNGQIQVNLDPNHSTIFFNPSNVVVFPEDIFSSSILVENVEDLFAVAMDVNFDPSLLQINSITEGSFLNQNGQVSTVFVTDIDNELGKAVIGITRLSSTSGVSSVLPQNILTINFSSIGSGLTQVNLSNLGLLAPDGVTSYPVLSENLNVQIKSDEAFIFGIITNNETGLPVQGVVVKALNYNSQPSNAQGQYLLKVPYGYGYDLEVISGFFEEMTIPDIHVPEHDPIREINIGLTPIPVIHELVNLLPNPNPEISTVQAGGNFHRYYKLINTYNGYPLSYTPIRVQSGSVSKVFSSDERGIVNISINSNMIENGNIGDEATFSVISINNQPVEEPVNFNAQVSGRRYERYWDSQNYIKFGGNFLGVDVDEVKFELGGITTLKIDESVSLFPDSILIDRQGRAGINFGFRVKSPGIKGEMGPVSGGIGAEAGVGISLTGVKEDGYEFPFETENNYQAIAKYILIADGNYRALDNTLIRLLTLCEWFFSDETTLLDANVSDAVGVEIKPNANAEAFAGIGDTNNLVSVGLFGNVGAEANAGLRFKFDHQKQQIESSLCISGKRSLSLSGGIKMNFPNDEFLDSLSAKIQIWDTDLRIGLKFTPVLSYSDATLKEFRLTILKRNPLQKWEEEFEYTISGEDAINAIENLLLSITQMIQAPAVGLNFMVTAETFQDIIIALFTLLYDLQVNESGEATISYQEKRTEYDSSPAFDIGIDVSATVISGKFGAGTSFETGRRMIVEEGKWVWGRHFVNQNYTTSIPMVMINYDDLMQQIVNETPIFIRTLMGDLSWIFFWNNKEDGNYVIGENGSFVIIPDSAIPPELDSIPVLSWSWYGGSPDVKLSDVTGRDREIALRNKERAEGVYGMEYGIGGFYQFEPYDLELLDTCWITLKYASEEVEDVNENTLSVYWEDKENKRWVYLGGIVDVENQTVTAPFQKIGLFTLAPSTPFGNFRLHIEPDTLNADGLSIATVVSDSIFNNDSTPINDGVLFSVGISTGQIISEDADTTLIGIQIPITDGKLEFQIRAHNLAGEADIRAYSVNGSATGETKVVFDDNYFPSPPFLTNAFAGNEKVLLNWGVNPENDLAGYRIYYDNDTIAPFEGIHTVYGEPSPITMGLDTLHQINGLFNDTLYYFAITSYDISGNESSLSNFVSAMPVSHFLVDLQVNPEGAGMVEGSGEYLPWQEVEISAIPNEGWKFVEWTENSSLVTEDSIHIFNIFSNRTFVANFVETTTSVQNISEKGLNIYPNPGKNLIWVELANMESQRINIQIINLHGQVLDQKIIEDYGFIKTDLNVSGLIPGIYLILVQTDNWKITRKLLIHP